MGPTTTAAAQKIALWLSFSPQYRVVWCWRGARGCGSIAGMTKQPRFIHLRLHTEYSLLEGAMRVKKLPGMVADAGMPAVAVTDTNNIFCALEFSELAAKAGVQPIIGCQFDVDYD